jgi:uncharacterized membrane protein
MFKRFQLSYILIFCVSLIGFGFIYIIQLPSTNSTFDKEAASLDTLSFSGYGHGKVTEVIFEQIDDIPNSRSITQQLKVVLSDDEKDGEEKIIEHDAVLDKAESVRYKVGDKVVLGILPAEVTERYVIVDRDRLNGIYIIIAVFILLALIVGRRRGLTSLIGLGITGCILLFFIAPQILSGKDPFLVALVGAGAIILVSMFISHGFNRRIQISAISTIVALAFTAVIANLFVYSSKLFGFSQGDAFLLETGSLGSINLQGILLAGIVISVLGVLDDVTTAQTAAVEELYKIDSSLTLKQLYQKGLSIGREHIASLINTLILVYAGAALPLFLLLTLQNSQPIWVLLNSEFIAEELVRSLIGSTTLILAVPISTFLAAYLYTRKVKNN